MVVVILQALGGFVFVAGTLLFGMWLRRNRSREQAERTSRVVQFLFWVFLVFPSVLGIFYPGLTHFDEIVGLSSLPFRPIALPLGIVLLLIGVYLTIASILALWHLGEGANAFRLTKRIVEGDLYQHTRNPMSIGYYLLCVGAGLVAGSTYATLASLLGIVPLHLFYLTYFEELELELRMGESYLQYKRSVPFLIPRFSLGGERR